MFFAKPKKNNQSYSEKNAKQNKNSSKKGSDKKNRKNDNSWIDELEMFDAILDDK